MKTCCDLKSPKTIILIIWLLFSIPFIAYVGWNYFNNFIYAKGMQAGQANAVVTLISEAAKCQPFPVTAQEKTINLISIECLQKQIEASKTQEATPEVK